MTTLVEKADDPRLPSVTLPAIVKPCCEDNSIGLALVHSTEELYKAVEYALTTDIRVVVQQYIPPGREIRVGVVELPDGTLQTLPKYEYFVSPEDPIRTMTHKYTDKVCPRVCADLVACGWEPRPSVFVTLAQCHADVPELKPKATQSSFMHRGWVKSRFVTVRHGSDRRRTIWQNPPFGGSM